MWWFEAAQSLGWFLGCDGKVVRFRHQATTEVDRATQDLTLRMCIE